MLITTERSRTDEQEAAHIALQTTYSKAAYESPARLPAHMVDRFIAICTPLAKHKTAVAQGLIDAGIMTLMDAAKRGWYPYPGAEDYEPPQVRRMLRDRMCTDALAALSERLYLAAQAQVMGGALHMQSHAASSNRVRRRPSWMAMGG